MIGIVVATHGEFGNSLFSTLRMILGDVEGITSISLLSEDSLETFREKLEKALKVVDSNNEGGLILVDMLGGTPFNVAVQIATNRKIQVVTGVNLPMLIKVASHRDASDLEGFTSELQEATRESIITTLDLFKKTHLNKGEEKQK